jgi:S1-C subfamily serine protease
MTQVSVFRLSYSRWPQGSPARIAAALLGLVLSYFVAAPVAADQTGKSNLAVANRAVVHIETTFFTHSYENPWNAPTIRRAAGTGFIVADNRIVTNAHVVSQANTLRVRRPNQRTDYEARVLHIAHDCDLAMLGVDDPAFFEDAVPLEIGPTPELNTPVDVIGFPIGGDRVSITRGVVSRMGMDLYSHSQIDSHLTIQVDAAINPGNSGGPALQDGRVIGVAFQTLSQGENLGYLIPPPVVNKFLTDIEDGHYDGYIEFGAFEMPTTNPTLRAAVGVEQAVSAPDTGVLIYQVIPGATVDGILKPGDILLEVSGKPVTESGDVEINGSLMQYSQLIDNLDPGDPIQVVVWRDGKKHAIELKARITDLIQFQRRNYDSAPTFVIYGGLVFQPLDANLMEAYAPGWAKAGRPEIFYRYNYYLVGEIYKNTKIDVVFSRRLADRVNLYAEEFEGRLVATVNGEAVQSFHQFVELVDRTLKEEQFLILRFHGVPRPLVLRSADVRDTRQTIPAQYGIRQDRHLKGRG